MKLGSELGLGLGIELGSELGIGLGTGSGAGSKIIGSDGRTLTFGLGIGLEGTEGDLERDLCFFVRTLR